MTPILNHLKEYIKSKRKNDLPHREMVERMIHRVKAENLTEEDLILRALTALENVEAKTRYEGIEIATRNRRELQKYFDIAIEQAVAQRDAIRLIQLQRLRGLLENPPEAKTRRIDPSTVDLALEVWSVMEENNWTMKQVAVEHFGDINEYDRIKKATQRVRKALNASKSVP